ncbi:MAG: biotin--[acetyl-CoA-carboxylase] ligase [Gammaproteobacteria bacterium]|nr:biotin--[acetyl-CoA-carboxylase] ligase [Gammaproteobacteria bacterium]
MSMTPQPLNIDAIKHSLSQLGWTHPLELICLDTTLSTNDVLKAHDSFAAYCVCVAESQTHGRGRLGRTWHSPEGGNLYCSIKLTVQHGNHALGPYSLIVGLSLLAAFKRLDIHPEIKLKWPNDLVFNGKKLGGILIEIVKTNAAQTTLIIGIGLNLDICPTDHVSNQAITALHLITPQRIDRNPLTAYLIDTLDTYLATYQRLGWQAFKQEWINADSLYGKPTTLDQAGKQHSGIAYGVDNQGQLLLQDGLGNTRAFSAGVATCHHPLML